MKGHGMLVGDDNSLPSQEVISFALLAALAKRGGSVCFSIEGRELEDELGKVYELNEAQRTQVVSSSKTRRRWRVNIQYARKKLVESGDIDGSVDDVWSLTPKGRNRADKFLKFVAASASPQDLATVLLNSPTFHAAMRRASFFATTGPKGWLESR